MDVGRFENLMADAQHPVAAAVQLEFGFSSPALPRLDLDPAFSPNNSSASSSFQSPECAHRKRLHKIVSKEGTVQIFDGALETVLANISASDGNGANSGGIWLDIELGFEEHIARQDLQVLQRHFHLHPVTLHDCMVEDHSISDEKLEFFKNYAFMIVDVITADPRTKLAHTDNLNVIIFSTSSDEHIGIITLHKSSMNIVEHSQAIIASMPSMAGDLHRLSAQQKWLFAMWSTQVHSLKQSVGSVVRDVDDLDDAVLLAGMQAHSAFSTAASLLPSQNQYAADLPAIPSPRRNRKRSFSFSSSTSSNSASSSSPRFYRVDGGEDDPQAIGNTPVAPLMSAGEILQRIGRARRQLTKLRRSFASKNDILTRLCSSTITPVNSQSQECNKSTVVESQSPKALQDADRFLRTVLDMVRWQMQRVEVTYGTLQHVQQNHHAVQNLSIAQASKDMNAAMKTMNAAIILTMPLTAIASILSMNIFPLNTVVITNSSGSGFFVGVLFAMLTMTICILVLFQKRGWL